MRKYIKFVFPLLLMLPVKLMAQKNKKQLPHDPKLVTFDAEKDSIYYYNDTRRIRRLFKPNIAETHVLIVKQRNVGTWHPLYDYGPDSTLVLEKGIKDILGRVYWIDNSSGILTAYQDDRILWTFNFEKHPVSMYSKGHVFACRFVGNHIMLGARQCWVELNRETGADEGGGCD